MGSLTRDTSLEAELQKYLNQNGLSSSIGKLKNDIDKLLGSTWHQKPEFSKSVFRQNINTVDYYKFLATCFSQMQKFIKEKGSSLKGIYFNNDSIDGGMKNEVDNIIAKYQEVLKDVTTFEEMVYYDRNVRYNKDLDKLPEDFSSNQFIDKMDDDTLKEKVLKRRLHNLEECSGMILPSSQNKYSGNTSIDEELYTQITLYKEAHEREKKYIDRSVTDYLQHIVIGPTSVELYKNIEDEGKYLDLKDSDENEKGRTKRELYRDKINKWFQENPEEARMIPFWIPEKFIYIYTIPINGNKVNQLKEDYFTLDNIAKYRQWIFGFTEDYLKYRKDFLMPVYQAPGCFNSKRNLHCFEYVDWSYQMNDLLVKIGLHKNKGDDDVIFPARFIKPENVWNISDVEPGQGEETIKIYRRGSMKLENILNDIIGLIMIKHTSGSKTHLRVIFLVNTTNFSYRPIEGGQFTHKVSTFNIKLEEIAGGLFMGNIAITAREFNQITQYYETNLYQTKIGVKINYFVQNKGNPKKPLDIMSELQPITVERIREPGIPAGNYKIIKNTDQHGGGDTANIKVLTSKKASVFTKEIAGHFFEEYLMKNFKQKYWDNRGQLTILSKNYYPYILITSNKAAHEDNTNLYSITKHKGYSSIFPNYYRFNEIIQKYLPNDIKSNTVVSVVGIDYSFLETIYKTNYKIKSLGIWIPDIEFTNSIRNPEIDKKYKKYSGIFNIKMNNISGEIYDISSANIPKSDIFCFSYYDYVHYCIKNLEQLSAPIVLWTGLISGLKFTKIGGTFIFYLYDVVYKPVADIYLIAKQYFEECYLYQPEITNPIKRSGTFACFKKFKGIIPDELDKLIKIQEQIQKIYPRGVQDFNIPDPALRQKFDIVKPLDPEKSADSYTYITGFLPTKLSGKNNDLHLYRDIIDHNNKRYLNQLVFVNRIIDDLDHPDTSIKETDLPTREQIEASVRYCKKWDIDYFPYFESNMDLLRDNMGEQILAELYGLIVPYSYEFKTPYQSYVVSKMEVSRIGKTEKKGKTQKRSLSVSSQRLISTQARSNKSRTKTQTKSPIKSKTQIKTRSNNKKSKTKSKSHKRVTGFSNFLSSILKDFSEETPKLRDFRQFVSLMDHIFISNNKLVQTSKMIDARKDLSRNKEDDQLSDYHEVNKLFRFYKYKKRGKTQDLSEDIRNITKNPNISQAWIKMYEILSETKLLNKKKGTLRTFHLCEAPGAFIDSINYFIKTKTSITHFDWHSQSLKSGIGDVYGLMKRHPHRWHLGKDGTGNITNLDNIKQYKRYCENIDFITSDCGLEMFHPLYHRVVYSSIVAILYLLPKDANMVFKLMSPVDSPIVWNAIYICFQNFKKFQFFKPTQNMQSSEFYIIGRGYLGTNPDIMDTLLHYVKNYDDNLDLMEDKYPEPFVRQAVKASAELADIWISTTEKQFYYQDNLDKMDQNFLKMAKEYLEEKNKDWLKKYKLKELPKRDYL